MIGVDACLNKKCDKSYAINFIQNHNSQRKCGFDTTSICRHCMNEVPSTQYREFQQELVKLLPRMQRFSLSLCSANRDESNELVQAACQRALERYTDYRPGTRMDRWVFSIMASLHKNSLRFRLVRQGNGIVDSDELTGQESHSCALTQIQFQELLEAVSELPQDQHSLVLLVCVEGYTYKEAADLMDVPKGTVMSRLSRAKSRLIHSMNAFRSTCSSNIKGGKA